MGRLSIPFDSESTERVTESSATTMDYENSENHTIIFQRKKQDETN